MSYKFMAPAPVRRRTPICKVCDHFLSNAEREAKQNTCAECRKKAKEAAAQEANRPADAYVR
jgi:tRNA(Ile2) C34 agmatinyltransferase TiaS